MALELADVFRAKEKKNETQNMFKISITVSSLQYFEAFKLTVTDISTVHLKYRSVEKYIITLVVL